MRWVGALALALVLAGCAAPAEPEPPDPRPPPVVAAPAPPSPPPPVFVPAAWAALPGWRQDRLSEVVPALLSQCAGPRLPSTEAASAIGAEHLADAAWWRATCTLAARLPAGQEAAARRFIQARFRPVALTPPDATPPAPPGLLTGYFEPVYPGCPEPGPGCTTALRARPPGLVDVDVGRFDPARAGGAHSRLR